MLWRPWGPSVLYIKLLLANQPALSRHHIGWSHALAQCPARTLHMDTPRHAVTVETQAGALTCVASTDTLQ